MINSLSHEHKQLGNLPSSLVVFLLAHGCLTENVTGMGKVNTVMFSGSLSVHTAARGVVEPVLKRLWIQGHWFGLSCTCRTGASGVWHLI